MKTPLKCYALPVALALLTPTALLAQEGAYTVQGKLGAKLPVGKAYLLVAGPSSLQLDSATITKGRFQFKGTVADPLSAQLLVSRPGRSFSLYKAAKSITLFLEPGIVRVTSPDSLPHAVLSGTPLNVDQQRLSLLTQASTDCIRAVMNEWRTASPEQRKDKAYQARFERLGEEAESAHKAELKQFIQANPGSLVSVYALQELGGFTPDVAVAGPLFESLTLAVRQSARGQLYAAKLDKIRKLAVGALAPDFTQDDPSGKPVKLSDFRGKFVLVDFWASWCGPCRQENPNVVANYNKYKDKNFTVLGVSLDRATGREAWLKAIDTDHLPWTQVSDLKFWHNEVAQLYEVYSIPQNLLIDPNGRIVAKNLRGEELGQKLAAVLPTTAQ